MKTVQTVCALCGMAFDRAAWRVAENNRLGHRSFCSTSCIEASPRKSLGPRRYGATAADKHTLTHSSWCSMWYRCAYPSNPKFHFYKDKTPPAAWLDFRTFLADMGTRPSKSHTLERVDNTKAYGPGNCIWATHAAQMRNNSRTRIVEFDGAAMCITDWAIRVGLPEGTLRRRLDAGWPIKKAITTPSQSNMRRS